MCAARELRRGKENKLAGCFRFTGRIGGKRLRPGTYKLVVTPRVTDVNDVALAQEYDAPLVIGR